MCLRVSTATPPLVPFFSVGVAEAMLEFQPRAPSLFCSLWLPSISRCSSCHNTTSQDRKGIDPKTSSPLAAELLFIDTIRQGLLPPRGPFSFLLHAAAARRSHACSFSEPLTATRLHRSKPLGLSISFFFGSKLFQRNIVVIIRW